MFLDCTAQLIRPRLLPGQVGDLHDKAIKSMFESLCWYWQNAFVYASGEHLLHFSAGVSSWWWQVSRHFGSTAFWLFSNGRWWTIKDQSASVHLLNDPEMMLLSHDGLPSRDLPKTGYSEFSYSEGGGLTPPTNNCLFEGFGRSHTFLKDPGKVRIPGLYCTRQVVYSHWNILRQWKVIHCYNSYFGAHSCELW